MVISRSSWEMVMLEGYYVRPVTVDRIRTSWIAPAIEPYVGWLAERRYASKTVLRRIPVVSNNSVAACEARCMGSTVARFSRRE